MKSVFDFLLVADASNGELMLFMLMGAFVVWINMRRKPPKPLF